MNEQAKQTYAWTVWTICMVALILLMARGVDAQQTNVAEVLAQTGVAESDWNTVDHAAQWHVYARRAEQAGVTVDVMAMHYSSFWRSKSNARYRWIGELTSACDEPRDWPASEGAWRRYRPKCLRVFAAAEAFLRGELADPCKGKAVHFGGAMDSGRAVRLRLVPVACGRTANVFYRVGGAR